MEKIPNMVLLLPLSKVTSFLRKIVTGYLFPEGGNRFGQISDQTIV